MSARYWVGGGSSTDWGATGNTNWGTASGVQDNASVPTRADDVFFDANSGTPTLSLGGAKVCKSLTTNGWAGTMTDGSNSLVTYGDVNFAGMTGSFNIRFQTGASGNYNLNGKAFYRLYICVPSHVITLTGNMGSNGYILCNGTLNCNGYSILSNNWVALYNSSGVVNFGSATHYISLLTAYTTAITGTFNLESSTINLSNVTPFNANMANCTINAGTSTININSTSTVALNLHGKTYNILNINQNGIKNITGAGAAVSTTLFGGTSGTINILDGGNNWGALSINAGKTIKFKEGVTQTVSSLTATGTGVSGITLQSASAGSQFTISDSSGTNTVSYCTIKDSNAIGGAIWDATDGTNTNQGNNSGWIFTLVRALFFGCD